MSIGCLLLLACLVAGAAAGPPDDVGPANGGPPPKTSELCPLLTANFRRNPSSSVPDDVGSGARPAHPHSLPGGCHELPSGTSSGVHVLQLSSGNCSRIPGAGAGHTLPVGSGDAVQLEAYCDMQTDGGGWTVVQRRANIEPRQSFDQNWETYKTGFGSLEGEFWWGLDKLSAMTFREDISYELRIDLSDWEGSTRYALYQDVRVAPESDGYRLTFGEYSGTAGDSLPYHFGMQFTTNDRDQDNDSEGSCALERGGGWWYKNCVYTNLNGVYYTEPVQQYDVTDLIVWRDWRGFNYSLKTVEMKIRPTNA